MFKILIVLFVAISANAESLLLSGTVPYTYYKVQNEQVTVYQVPNITTTVNGNLITVKAE